MSAVKLASGHLELAEPIRTGTEREAVKETVVNKKGGLVGVCQTAAGGGREVMRRRVLTLSLNLRTKTSPEVHSTLTDKQINQ